MAKGSSFEREMARKLSLWWSDGKADDWFWRTGGSGGRATSRAKSGKQTANGTGDICAQNGEAQRFLNLASIECKKGYATATISELLDTKSGGTMQKFVTQAKTGASLAGVPFWILIHKRDRKDALTITNMACLVGERAAFFTYTDIEPYSQFYCAKYEECFTRQTRLAVESCLSTL